MQKRTLPKGSSVRECYAKVKAVMKRPCLRVLYKSERCQKATVYENAMQKRTPPFSTPGFGTMDGLCGCGVFGVVQFIFEVNGFWWVQKCTFANVSRCQRKREVHKEVHEMTGAKNEVSE